MQLYVKADNFFGPIIPGHEIYNCPTMAFLITNQSTGKRILFDAGGRKDYWNYSPLVAGRFEKVVNCKGLKIEIGVHEVLENGWGGFGEFRKRDLEVCSLNKTAKVEI
jgi:hypothetical protein